MAKRKSEDRSSRPESSSERKKRLCNGLNTEDPEYVFCNGCRITVPYVYAYSTFAKQRWKGDELLHVFAREFAAYSKEYYLHAIVSGKLTVNGKPTTASYRIQDGDLIVHKTHRHEPPVTDEAPTIVFEDQEFIAFNKPASIPVHPCGAYRFNSLYYIMRSMRQDLNTTSPHFIHRLDRLTSGLIIVAKNAQLANRMSKLMATNKPSKTYFARVKGHFPSKMDDSRVVDALDAFAKAQCAAASVVVEDSSKLRIVCPVSCRDQKQAVWECNSDGKPSETLVCFENGVDDGTTVVRCEPITGRTHQIRLHLQLIGFPIANDPCYGGTLNFGERTAAAETEVVEQATDGTGSVDYSAPQRPDETELDFMKRTCRRCAFGDEHGRGRAKLHCARIWLHAYEYRIAGRVFSTAKPRWAE